MVGRDHSACGPRGLQRAHQAQARSEARTRGSAAPRGERRRAPCLQCSRSPGRPVWAPSLEPEPPSASPHPALLLPRSPHGPSHFLSPCLGVFAQQFHLLTPLPIPARPGKPSHAPRPGSVLFVRASPFSPSSHKCKAPAFFRFPGDSAEAQPGELGGCLLQGWPLLCSPQGPHPTPPPWTPQDSWP